MKKTLIIFEKKSQMENLLKKEDFKKLIQDTNPTIILTKMLTGYRFKYPVAKYNDYPLTKLPEYINISNETYDEVLDSYDQLIIATDFDKTGLFSAHKILKEKIGEDWNRKFPEIFVYNEFGENRNYIDEAKELIKEASIKYYFDYNYNINSQVFFKEILKKANLGKNKNITITKYMTLILFLIEKGEIKKYFHLLSFMVDYKGTGKYSPKEIGSPASYMLIIDNLKKLGLVLDKNYGLTEDGEKFISLLVKQQFDPDLPMRLRHWEKLSFKEAKIKIDRYLLSTFKRQKNKNKKL